jgi:hypothetical protein
MSKIPVEDSLLIDRDPVRPYRRENETLDVQRLKLSVGRSSSRGSLARIGIMTKLLHDLLRDITRHSVCDDNIALEELRRHVGQRILETCLKRELESQTDEVPDFDALTKIGSIMTDLSQHNPPETVSHFSRFEDIAKVAVKLLRRPDNDIFFFSNISNILLTSIEFNVLTSISLELILNSLRHAFHNGRSGFITVSLEEKNNGKDVELLVSDNGCGVSDIVFSQGLRLVTRLSTVLCGDIAVRQQDGGGTGIALTFPRANSQK